MKWYGLGFRVLVFRVLGFRVVKASHEVSKRWGLQVRILVLLRQLPRLLTHRSSRTCPPKNPKRQPDVPCPKGPKCEQSPIL